MSLLGCADSVQTCSIKSYYNIKGKNAFLIVQVNACLKGSPLTTVAGTNASTWQATETKSLPFLPKSISGTSLTCKIGRSATSI